MATHLRRIVVLLFANLGASALFALLTVLFRDDVITHQLAAGSDQTPDELAASLWIRAGLVLVVALFYVWIARRMRQGRRGAYMRVRTIAVLGFVGVAYLLVSGAYPAWLRGVQIGQLVLLAALVVATNLRAVRESFPRSRAPRDRCGIAPALVLVVVTPVVAEVLLGTVSLAMAWVALLYIPLYGAGALLVRELVRRAGGGWGSLLLMGVVYGLVEEGLALQSLTSPTLYGAGGWAPRLLGVNTAYTELNLPYHAVFSILIPITVVELLFPRLGTRPWLRTPGVVIAGVVTLLGAALIRLSVPTSIDPDYTIPLTAVVAIVVLTAVLTIMALGVVPRRGRPVPPWPSPTPLVTALVCGAGVLVFLGLLYPFGGATQPAFTHGPWVLAPMAGAAAVALGAGTAVVRWSAAAGWCDAHRIAAIGAALVAHTAFGALAKSDTTPDRVAMVLLAVVTAVLFAGWTRVSAGRHLAPALSRS